MMCMNDHEDSTYDLECRFFTPLHESFETALNAISKLHGKSPCYPVMNDILPDELGMTQFKMKFQLDKDGEDRYPLSFRSLSNNKEKEKLDHVMYSVVYPKIRMDIVTFKTMIQQLPIQIQICKNDTSDVVWEPSRTAAPSSQRMRFLCEALYAYVLSSKSSNDALLAYALYHHIGANDVPYDDIKNNCLFTRLIFMAIEAFDLSPQCLRYLGSLGLMADAVYSDIRDEFEPGVAPPGDA